MNFQANLYHQEGSCPNMALIFDANAGTLYTQAIAIQVRIPMSSSDQAETNVSNSTTQYNPPCKL